MTNSIEHDMKLARVQQALLEGRSQNWIEVNLKVSYQTIVKERKKLALKGLWPPKPQMKFLERGSKFYATHEQFRALYKSVCQELIDEGKTTLEKMVEQGALNPDGSVPPDEVGFDAENAFYPVD